MMKYLSWVGGWLQIATALQPNLLPPGCSEERLSILQSMGFAFGEVAQLTEEWEHRFDQVRTNV